MESFHMSQKRQVYTYAFQIVKWHFRKEFGIVPGNRKFKGKAREKIIQNSWHTSGGSVVIPGPVLFYSTI